MSWLNVQTWCNAEPGPVNHSPVNYNQLLIPPAADSQKDNFRLKQHLLDLRRAARRSGCNLTSSEILLTYPELEQGVHDAHHRADNASQTVPPLHSHHHR